MLKPNSRLNKGIKQRHSLKRFYSGLLTRNDDVELDKEEGDRINMSISRKAYDALATYTRQVNEKNNDIQKKPFTIEEVLDEEIIFLFSDEWKKD